MYKIKTNLLLYEKYFELPAINVVIGIISFFVDKICFSVNEYNITNTKAIFVIKTKH